jgi:hypothetical protein
MVDDAFWGFGDEIAFRVIKKTPNDFEVAETVATEIHFNAVIQPMPVQQLLIKPEGQRSWKWWHLWTTQCLDLDNIVQDQDGLQFRVMSRADWRGANYISYELVQWPTS